MHFPGNARGIGRSYDMLIRGKAFYTKWYFPGGTKVSFPKGIVIGNGLIKYEFSNMLFEIIFYKEKEIGCAQWLVFIGEGDSPKLF